MNEITLEHMMNPNLYDKYKHINNPIKLKQRKKDLQKYKQKIIHTTKLMFDNESKNETLNAAFNHYIDECIAIYKTKELQKKPLPEHSPYINDISYNFNLQEQNKTIVLDKFVKFKKKSNKKSNVYINDQETKNES
tara:strand:- start:65 stop:472 length:408 start_codon:yes stop_codon:yes gene_type:complete